MKWGKGRKMKNEKNKNPSRKWVEITFWSSSTVFVVVTYCLSL